LSQLSFLFLNSARRWGGNEQWTRLAAQALARKHRVLVVCRSRRVAERLGVPAIRLPFVNEADPVTLWGLVALILRHRTDILIPTKRKDYVLAGLASRLTGRINLLRLGIVRRLGGGVIDRLVYGALADGIIVNAESIRKALLESAFIRPERVRVIYNGVNVAKIQRLARQPSGEARLFERQVVAVGLLSLRKGYDRLLRGWARFLQRKGAPEEFGLVILGDGPDAGRILALSRELGLERSVRFLGHKDNPFPVVAASEVFVTASRNEGIPNAMLEAMALGKPVIATRAGGIAEVIRPGENGVLVPSDEKAWADALEELLGDEALRHRLGEKARATVQEKFHVERMAEEIARFAEEVRWRKGS